MFCKSMARHQQIRIAERDTVSILLMLRGEPRVWVRKTHKFQEQPKHPVPVSEIKLLNRRVGGTE